MASIFTGFSEPIFQCELASKDRIVVSYTSCEKGVPGIPREEGAPTERFQDDLKNVTFIVFLSIFSIVYTKRS
jgi:hypothetical protein